MPEATLSAQRLLQHMRSFRARGGMLPDDGMLASLGISETQLEHSQKRFPVRLISLAAEVAATQLRDPVLGLTLANDFNNAERCFMIEMARNATNLNEFVGLLSRYTCLYTEIATFDIEHRDDDMSAIVYRSPVENEISRHQIDGGMVMLCEALSLFSGRRPEWVELRHAPPANYERRYEEACGCPVLFSQTKTCAVLPTHEMFTHRERSGDKAWLIHYERRRDQLCAESLSDKVVFMIRKSLVHGEPIREVIAAELCLSVRTMQRTLASENTTFKKLLESTRSDLAKQYLLRSPFTVAQVALLLGYSESSQFYQAFRRWNACSPGEFKARFSKPPCE